MTQVFLSHSSADAEFAKCLATDLRAAGIPVWKAPESILPGEEWVPAIQRGLTTSTHLVLLQSPEAVDSKWVNFEFNSALALERRGKMCIMPIDYQPCTPPLFWTQFQQVTGIHDDYNATLLRMQARLQENQPNHLPEPAPLATTLNITSHEEKAAYSDRPAEPPPVPTHLYNENTQLVELLERRHYLDVESEKFGHHPLSERLVEARVSEGESPRFVRAQSWVTFVFYPSNGSCIVNTVSLKEKLRPVQRIGRGPEWYHGIPHDFLHTLSQASANPQTFTASGHYPKTGVEGLAHFIQAKPSGYTEIGYVYPLFLQSNKLRLFHFVNLVGCLWQMIYLVKAIYDDVAFNGQTAVKVNLVGTYKTYLDGYAKGWSSDIANPLSGQLPCSEKNVQIGRTLALADSSDEEIEAVVRDIAKDISLYYEQDFVKSFNHGTGEFPVDEYNKPM